MNVNKLKGKIVEKGMNMSDVANQIGVDRSTLYRKINTQGDNLTVSEVSKIATVLDLSSDEITNIFFN